MHVGFGEPVPLQVDSTRFYFVDRRERGSQPALFDFGPSFDSRPSKHHSFISTGRLLFWSRFCLILPQYACLLAASNDTNRTAQSILNRQRLFRNAPKHCLSTIQSLVTLVDSSQRRDYQTELLPCLRDIEPPPPPQSAPRACPRTEFMAAVDTNLI